jgi:hypothetical protein
LARVGGDGVGVGADDPNRTILLGGDDDGNGLLRGIAAEVIGVVVDGGGDGDGVGRTGVVTAVVATAAAAGGKSASDTRIKRRLAGTTGGDTVGPALSAMTIE